MFGFDESWLLSRLQFLIPLVLCLSVHEWAHAWSAWKLGDDTARHLGRLTLNPLAHIDPLGTFLLPILGVPFGWAKPVPFNPMRFEKRVSLRIGTLAVAMAGPISNFVMAICCLLLMLAMNSLAPTLSARLPALQALLQQLLLFNVVLALFNLLPVPPLDGSYLAETFMPRFLRPAWDSFASFGPLALLAVLILPMLLGVSLFAWPIELVQQLSRWVSSC